MFNVKKMIVLFMIIAINYLVYFLYYHDTEYDLNDLTKKSTISKIFIHENISHLNSNMFSLLLASFAILNSNNITLLANQYLFGTFYIVSGFVSSYGKDLLYNFLLKTDQINKENYMNKFKCDYFFCGVINSPLSLATGLFYDISNSYNYLALYFFNKTIDLGANGCIYAIIGSSIAYSLASNDNDKYIALISVVYQLIVEIYYLPKNLDILKEYQFKDEKIGHHVHITGFVFGLVVGFLTLTKVWKFILFPFGKIFKIIMYPINKFKSFVFSFILGKLIIKHIY